MCFLCILNFFLKFNVFIFVILKYINIDINDKDLGDINIATSNYFLNCIFLLFWPASVLSLFWYYLVLFDFQVFFLLQSNSEVCALISQQILLSFTDSINIYYFNLYEVRSQMYWIYALPLT